MHIICVTMYFVLWQFLVDNWKSLKMNSVGDMGQMLLDTFVPKWIYGPPAHKQYDETRSLEAFRQRIYMQQVICSHIWYLTGVLKCYTLTPLLLCWQQIHSCWVHHVICCTVKELLFLCILSLLRELVVAKSLQLYGSSQYRESTSCWLTAR